MLFCFPTINAEHIASRYININTIKLWIVFCKYYSRRILSPYHSINHLLQKSEAFQSVHHVTFILCYNVLSDFFTFAAASVGTEQMSCTLVFSLNKVYKHWRDITQGKFTCDKSNVFKGLQRIYYKI